jgi:hypothetical protein
LTSFSFSCLSSNEQRLVSIVEQRVFLSKGNIVPTEKCRTVDEEQIRQLMEDRANAVRAKDLKGSMSGYLTDVLTFDVVDPLQKLDWMHVENAPRSGIPRSRVRSTLRIGTSALWQAMTWRSVTA